MKLIEALQIVRQAASAQTEPLSVFLACSFAPLHLQTLLAAHLQLFFPSRRVEVRTGLYGDLMRTIEAITEAKPEFVAVVLEWPDLDPRLGIRHPSGWGPKDLPDILEASARRLALLEQALQRASGVAPTSLVLPTLPLPPVAYVQSSRASPFHLRLRGSLNAFAARLSEVTDLRFVSEQCLDQESPLRGRWDIKGDLLSGFPYKLAHASLLAFLLAQLLAPAAPKKGLITDLDDTLWGGILGEVGEENISWDLDHGTQSHALYQILLRSLAETGVLIAAATKNDQTLVREAFQRKDLLLPPQSIFPCEAHWGRKSSSVGHILRAWNIAADSVVFVDDSPMELSEVKAEHPEIECILFPRVDPQALLSFLQRLRDLFGKSIVTPEDALRRESVQTSGILTERRPANDDTANDLLREAEAAITLSFKKEASDPRPLELVNKTNQFNLNGKRYTEASWCSYLTSPVTILMVVSYQDKYSMLGKIAAIAGQKEQSTLIVDTWVMSCRAFSRQIEHRCLAEAFNRFGVDKIVFRFSPTPRNGPLQDFFQLFLGYRPEGEFQLTRQIFREKCPPLFQSVRDVADG
jgi:FkbH-like protein